MAECHSCGTLGRFRNPASGRPRQHNTKDQLYCGYFSVNPRLVENVTQEIKRKNDVAIAMLNCFWLPQATIDFSLTEDLDRSCGGNVFSEVLSAGR